MTHEQMSSYLKGRIGEALATDERTHMLDVQIKVAGEKVFLFGNVPCANRRAAAESVVREVLPADMNLVNGLCVENYSEPIETEHLG